MTELVLRECPVLACATPLSEAVGELLRSDLPALPVEDERGRYAGIFGEREFIGALFPKYLQTVGYVGFVTHSIEDVLERRSEAPTESVRQHMTTEHVDVSVDVADVQLAETFLSHRVIVIPVTEAGRVRGVVTRAAFFTALAERFLSS